ncbi:MAG: hypothetical protein MUP69_10260 [Candidatus Atribacteria bacterium]|nr:hypothetical protein [Candidatus Atribacteria bacterium]
MQQKTPEPTLLEIPGAEGLSVNYLTDLLKNYQAPTKNIPLQQIAGMTGNEQTVQNLLSKFLGTTATESPAYKLGMSELNKTLGSEYYDPTKSDFWKGFREKSKTEEAGNISDIRRRGQLGGGLYSEPQMRTESEARSAASAERSTQLGSLYENERNRKANATATALGYAGFEETGVMNRLNAGSTIGAIPRNIENQKYQATYNQALGQTEADYASSVLGTTVKSGVASSLMPQWYVDNTQQADPLSGILGIVGSLIGKGK